MFPDELYFISHSYLSGVNKAPTPVLEDSCPAEVGLSGMK